MSNLKAWVTLAIFGNSFFHHFIPGMKLYFHENGIHFKILFILDNAPGHPTYLDDFHLDVPVVYLPPNITSLLQPMDQGVIANLKKYYTHTDKHWRQLIMNLLMWPYMTWDATSTIVSRILMLHGVKLARVTWMEHERIHGHSLCTILEDLTRRRRRKSHWPK